MAQKSIAQLQSEVNSLIVDNTSGLITPAILRNCINQLIGGVWIGLGAPRVDNALLRYDGTDANAAQGSGVTLSDAGALAGVLQVAFTPGLDGTTILTQLTPGFVADAGGGFWGSRKTIVGGSARLAPLQFFLDVPVGQQHKYAVSINRLDNGDNSGTAGQLTLDYGLLVSAARGSLNHTRVHGIHIDVDDSSVFAAPAAPMVGLNLVSTIHQGSKGNLIAIVSAYLDEDGSTDFVNTELTATMFDGAAYTNASVMHLVAATRDTAVAKGTLQSFIWMHTSPENGNNQGGDVNKALRFTEEVSVPLQGHINYIIHATTSPGAGVGALAYHTGTMGRGLWFEGTYDLAVFDVPGLKTLVSSMKLGTSATYDIFHNSAVRQITLAGGSSAGAGGRIALYGETHATKASFVELTAANTVITTVAAYANDAAAAAGGVPVGGLYRIASAVQIRVV